MKKMDKVYLAGPMSGIKDHNRENFLLGEGLLKFWEYEVFNPLKSEYSIRVQKGEIKGTEAYRICLFHDLEYITKEADIIAFLPGWESSSGSMAEFFTAKACGLKVIYLSQQALDDFKHYYP